MISAERINEIRSKVCDGTILDLNQEERAQVLADLSAKALEEDKWSVSDFKEHLRQFTTEPANVSRYAEVDYWSVEMDYGNQESNDGFFSCAIRAIFEHINIFECNDEIEEAVTEASRVITDAFYVQNGCDEIAEDHDDEWFDLQEQIRAAMLEAASQVVCRVFPQP